MGGILIWIKFTNSANFYIHQLESVTKTSNISACGVFFPIRNSLLKKGKPKPMKTNMYTRIYSTTSIYHIIKHHSESTSTIYRKTGKNRLKNINTDNFLLYQTSYFVSCDYSDKQKTSKDVHSSVLYNSSTKCRDET